MIFSNFRNSSSIIIISMTSQQTLKTIDKLILLHFSNMVDFAVVFFYSVRRLLAEIVDNFRCCCFFALFKLFALLAPISFKCIMNVLNSQKRSTTLIMKFPHKFACRIVHQSVDKKNIHEKETETSIQAADAIDTTHLVTR